MVGQSALFSLCSHYSEAGQALGGGGNDCRGCGERREVVVVVFLCSSELGLARFCLAYPRIIQKQISLNNTAWPQSIGY